MNLKSIGKIGERDGKFTVEVDQLYKDGLLGLEGFSHVMVLWWADQLAGKEYRQNVVIDKPYKPGPEKVGVFATRSPMRPNPIAVTVIAVADLNIEEGLIETYFIDAEIGTPILDIKPFMLCCDFPEASKGPEWSEMLPKSIDESGRFDWSQFFNF